MSQEHSPYYADPGAVYALLDVLNEHQIRKLSDLLHQVRAHGDGYGEVSLLIKKGNLSLMSIKINLDVSKDE